MQAGNIRNRELHKNLPIATGRASTAPVGTRDSLDGGVEVFCIGGFVLHCVWVMEFVWAKAAYNKRETGIGNVGTGSGGVHVL